MEYIDCTPEQAGAHRHARVRAEWPEPLCAALCSHRGCTPVDIGGRGVVERFPYPGGEGILRRYRRGGILRHFVAEGFLIGNRPRAEFELLCWAHEQGLPVPAPLGVVWERRSGVIRGAIATHALNAVNLLDWLRSDPEDPDPVLRDCGALIRRMHDLGIWHADLQVANVLVAQEGLYLIDFDKARRMAAVPDRLRGRNLLRFRRSLEKRCFPPHFFDAVCSGYGRYPWNSLLEHVYALKGRLSDLLRRG